MKEASDDTEDESGDGVSGVSGSNTEADRGVRYVRGGNDH